MPRMRKTAARDIQRNQEKLDGMKAIEPGLDLGEGVSVKTVGDQIKKVTDLINAYNNTLATADQQLNQINDEIKVMNDLGGRVTNGVKFKYGSDSSEYEMVGGVRTSERKKRSPNSGSVS